jgi:hypothetical protein
VIIMTTPTKMTDRSVIATCPPGISLRATGLSSMYMSSASSAVLPVPPVRERSERPIQASAVAAAAAQAQAYAFAATNGAGAGTAKDAQATDGQALNGAAATGQALNGNAFTEQQKTQHGSKWAFRGLQPWSDPA